MLPPAVCSSLLWHVVSPGIAVSRYFWSTICPDLNLPLLLPFSVSSFRFPLLPSLSFYYGIETTFRKLQLENFQKIYY